jgi:hypothetical protein
MTPRASREFWCRIRRRVRFKGYFSMRHSRRLATRWVGLVLCAVFVDATAVEHPGGTLTVPLSTEEIRPAQFNGDVRDLPLEYGPPRYLHHWNEFERPLPRRAPPPSNAPNGVPESVPAPAAPMPAPITNFPGLAFDTAISGGQAGAGWPPDTNGDVGPTVYIQAVNDAFGIFDKSTGARIAAFTENQLWSGAATGTPCDSQNQGDPVVLHDALTDRWILTDFAFGFSAGNPVAPFYECIAVSKSNDPVAGGWYLYAVRMDTGGSGAPPTNTFADYPKFGVWTDCLYLGANGFNNGTGSYAGAVFAAFDRNALYSGAPLTGSNSSVGFINDPNVYGNFPAHLLGNGSASLPPSGRPEFFVQESLTSFAFDVRTFQKGATACGAGATLSSPTSVSQNSYGYPAIKVGSSYTTDMVRQPSTTNKLDSLGDELMQRVVYRKIGASESLWVVHTTCGSNQDAMGYCLTSTTTTQPQWAQIDVSGGSVASAPVQQQIYAPDTTKYRWLGSLAVDAQGDMALGYSLANGSSPNFPSIAYAGRLVGDPANQLPQSETLLVAGGGSQTNSCGGAPCHRWGDYSAMGIDPTDDCTFWYTSEYYDTSSHGSAGVWQTEIGSFKFSSCSSVIGSADHLEFRLQPAPSYTSGAPISVEVVVADGAGHIVPTSTASISLALSGGTSGATLSGTKTLNATNGVAVFGNLSVDKAGTGYQLVATASGLSGASSASFAISPGAASQLAFTTQPPSSSPAGGPFGVAVAVQDAAGNTVTTSTASISLALSGGTSGAALSGTPTVQATNGVATFSGLAVNKVGTGYQLNATATGLTGASSSAFAITAGAPAQLVFTQQPQNGTANINLAPVAVTVQDALGNVVTGDSHSVSLTIASGPGGFDPSSTTTVAFANGVATFSNLILNTAGNYTLQANDAADGNLTVVSNAFTIAPGTAAKLIFTAQPADVTAGNALGSVAVTEYDASNNVVPDNSTSVDFAIAACAGTIHLGSAPMVNGVATLNPVQRFYTVASGLSVTANDAAASLTQSSAAFAVIANSDLVFSDGYEGCRP